ncbi:hypothetical protein CH254_06775 [Rhodococcus sp. 06-412-2C]|uniref:helix-turn-helix domain-containing protein n=1 Tax=unclassified Rhodococcus (in: high G+C Gram-positive bacteria) TaxID=192944 RepID=UPI000B9C2F22|nr:MULTISPECIES: XRE family transcriptional regulator [unclassified Rhodococcus (in: high G+C Gram-positive bacteria)]OZC90624.1 hypothetical protein CH254_06775 [Rhodococcus sp. 06-412-2C]OZC98120.1 hypothetical protein CH279_11220 [Rhodococcus sp. 06-412-2B]
MKPNVGTSIRALRKRAGLSATSLAAACGISQPFLSQVERGVSAPSLSTLYALADALGVGVSELLEPSTSEVAAEESQVIRASEGADQFARVLIGGGASTDLEAYEHFFTPGDGDRGWFAHPGQDFLYVLEGSVELQRAGMPATTLRTGAAILYAGEIAHRCVLRADAAARTLLVCINRPVEGTATTSPNMETNALGAPHQ